VIRFCPLFDLDKALGFRSNGNNDDLDFKYLIVISLGDRKFCIAVDKLVDRRKS